jgi:Mg/Co/Ni transporter MgtE
MAYGLSWLDRLLMPFYSPAKLARILGKTPPTVAIMYLRDFPARKAYDVISYWPEKVQITILTSMGDYALKVIEYMEPERVIKAMVNLSIQMVRRLSTRYSISEFRNMLTDLREDDKIVLFAKLPSSVSSALVRDLPAEERVKILCCYKPWVATALMEQMEAKDKAAVLDALDVARALDIFDRWGDKTRSAVLLEVSEARREEIINALMPRTLAPILSEWSEDFAAEIVAFMEEEKQFAVVKKLPQEYQKKIFPLLSVKSKVRILKSQEPAASVELLTCVEKVERDSLLGQLYPDLADNIRKLLIMK